MSDMSLCFRVFNTGVFGKIKSCTISHNFPFNTLAKMDKIE